MAGAAQCGNSDGCSNDIAPYSQQLGDFFTTKMSVLVKGRERNYRPKWG